MRESRWPGIVGVVLYLPSGWIYLASGLMVPLAGLVVLWLTWLAGLGLVVWAAARRSLWALAGLPAAVAFWFAYLTFGEQLFGWRP